MRKSIWIVAIATLFVAISTAPVSRADITSIDITGSYADPTITINGSGFGSTAPTGTAVYCPASLTQCGTGSDYVYGANYLADTFFDHWAAGCGGTDYCTIGILISSWTDTSVTYTLGSCYQSDASGCGSYPPIATGDSICANITNPSTGTTYTNCGSPSIASLTPEPGTAVLWLTGIGLMILMRKRLADLLRLDTNSSLSLPSPN